MRIYYLRLIFSFLFLLTLAGCATTHPSSSSSPLTETKQNKPALTWDNRVTKLSSIHNWDLKGLIAINTPKNAVSANWQWEQRANRSYTIGLYGPLGASSLQLTGGPQHVLLEMSDGKKFNASSPESLLQQQMGWHLPVSNLYYWVRGLPVPGGTGQKQFDADNHLTSLVQDNWTIHYLDYNSVNDIDLPSKIFLSNSDMTVKIVIKHWQI